MWSYNRLRSHLRGCGHRQVFCALKSNFRNPRLSYSTFLNLYGSKGVVTAVIVEHVSAPPLSLIKRCGHNCDYQPPPLVSTSRDVPTAVPKEHTCDSTPWL